LPQPKAPFWPENRTELILFIRPTVIKDPIDASVIAEEMRQQDDSRLVGTSKPGHRGRSQDRRRALPVK